MDEERLDAVALQRLHHPRHGLAHLGVRVQVEELAWHIAVGAIRERDTNVAIGEGDDVLWPGAAQLPHQSPETADDRRTRKRGQSKQPAKVRKRGRRFTGQERPNAPDD